MATAMTANPLRSSNIDSTMRQRFATVIHYPDQYLPKLPAAPLLSYPLVTNHSAIVVSDSKAASDLAQCTAWDIREHDLDRFLDARHGCKIEDFWTLEFIHTYGREYCEKLLQYIILFNQEEVGGYAVMFVDQMMMWQPHYFPYAMKYKPNVDDLFEPDQIEHFGRKFLEKVVQWCKIAYQMNKAAWDRLLDDPPSGAELEAFIAMVQQQHTPSKLKTMNIVPEGREDDWPCNYFARARAKTVVPKQQLEKEAAQKSTSNTNNNVRATAVAEQKTPAIEGATKVSSIPIPAAIAKETQSSASAANGIAAAEVTGNGQAEQKPTVTRAVIGNKAKGNDDGDDSDSDKKRRPRRDSRLPQSPQGKKVALQEESKDRLAISKDLSDRRVQSAPQSRANPPDVQASRDWLNVPVKKEEGRSGERRAVSNEQQSKLVASAAQPYTSSPRPAGVPPTGRGGAIAAVGQYEYRPGVPPPVFAHAYGRDVVVQNNAAYLYHEDHSFGRHPVPLPDHATTYRPGSNIYTTDPVRRDMFVPNPNPPPHFSHVRNQSGMYLHTMGNATSQGPRAGPPNAFFAQVQSQPPSYAPSPQLVQTAPHGVVPNHIMAPYIEMAAANKWPNPHIAPMSRVHQQPTHPGYPPMRTPAPAIARPHHPFANQTPQVANASPRPAIPTMQQQIDLVRAGTIVATPMVPRRDLVRSEPTKFSPQAMQFQPSGGVYPQSIMNYRRFPLNGPPTAPKNRPHRPSKENLPPRRGTVGSQDTLPFPSYMETMDNPIGLPEDKQCEANFIGPAAEDVCTLWFADIPPGTTSAQLRDFIARVIPVKSIRDVAYNDSTSYNKGWTFVDFLSNRDTRNALQHFSGRPFNGGQLKVQVPTRRTQTWALAHPQDVPVGLDEDVGAPTGHRPSFTGSNTPYRNGFNPFTGSPTARRPRGSSLSQAASAVRRNSAFTSQDARSDLPLEQLPEVKETSKPASPAPSQAIAVPEVAVDDDHVQGSKMSKSQKKKKAKRKAKDKSRDTSMAPSDSNISSIPGASGTSSRPSTADGSKVASASQTRPELKPPQNTGPTYASIANAAKVSKVVTNAKDKSDLSSLLQPEVNLSTWADEAELASAEDNPDVVPAISPETEPFAKKTERFEDTISTDVNLSESGKGADTPLNAPVETVSGAVDGSPEDAEHKQDLAVEVEPAQERHDGSDQRVDASHGVLEAMADAQVSTVAIQQSASAPVAAAKQSIDEEEEQDAVASIAGMSDNKSEATTIPVEQPAVSAAKSKKAAGPAQTESLSAFGSKKQQKAAQKAKQIQAKKARKASRKVSNNSTGTIITNAAKEDTFAGSAGNDEDKVVVEDSKEKMKMKGRENDGGAESISKEREQVQRKPSESSSVAGTPETAREYPASAPNTPAQTANSAPSFSLGSQSDRARGDSSEKEDNAEKHNGDKVDSAGKPAAKGLSTALEGELKSDHADSLDRGQQSQRSSRALSSGNLDSGPVAAAVPATAKKAENKAPAATATMTYAQMAKSEKETKAKKDPKVQGLSVRDVNVPH